jgi:ribosome biogenesis GTPase
MPKRRLTQHQRRRIDKAHAERRFRTRSPSKTQSESGTGAEETALVLAHHGRELLVQASDRMDLRAHPRQHIGDLVAGDHVVIQRLESGSETAVIVAREPRRSVLERVDTRGRGRAVAANIDQVLLLIAVEPFPQRYLIDRYLAAAALVPAEALLVLNKVDLIESDSGQEYRELLQSYRQAGFPTAAVSAIRGDGLPLLRGHLRGHTSVIVGQSGVGKSSLVKALLPEAEVRIGGLSDADAEGRHTTRTSRLYHLPEGGQLIDSPGVRGFDPGSLIAQNPERGFREFATHLGHCRFGNCTHTVEPGCAIRAAVEAGEIDPRRYESYLRLRRDLDGKRAQ